MPSNALGRDARRMIGAAVRTLFVLALAAVAAAALAAPSHAEGCPRVSFVRLGDFVYRSYGIPPTVELPTGKALGQGLADLPGGDDGCNRKQKGVTVLAYDGIDPGVAVAVRGLPSLAFVLGNKCVGFTGDERWACLKTPLVLDGEQYVATSYPAQPPPRRTLPLADSVARIDLGGEEVTAVEIDGVDPSLAVGVAGRPSVAYVALGVCTYELFDNRPLRDDLRRCLSAPTWLRFDPPAARSGDAVVARSDRPIPPGRTLRVSLVRRDSPGDIVPKDRAGGIEIGTLQAGAGSSFEFEAPKADAARYVAVATCDGCAGEYRGRSVFPAGSFLLGEKGSSGPRLIMYLLAALLIGLVIGAFVVRRRGWTRGGRRPPVS
jgi:hypothetical protein